MGERYWISGVQLGMLIVLSTERERKKMVDEIIEKQFVGNTNTYEDN
jgi:mannose/fructose-specific phosphotransferase system component IIA